MFRILITDELSPQALDKLRTDPDVQFDVVKGESPEELSRIVKEYDAWIIRSRTKITADLIKQADRLKVVGRAGVGLDNVDIQAASVGGIMVMNTPGANTVAAAEFTIAVLLALCRHIPGAHGSMQKGDWRREDFLGVELYGKTLGVIGLGQIGAQVVRRCQAFGLHILTYDPYLSDDVARELNVDLVDLETLLSSSDFVSLHVPLTPETTGMIGADQIGMMKKGVRLINCARGKLIDEAALVDGIRSGQIGGAALDVYEYEPLPRESPLRTLPNVLTTPHLAANTTEALRDVGTQIVDQVLDALREVEFRNAVNMPPMDPEEFRRIRPYLDLAERVGNLQMQLADGPVKRVEVELEGEEIETHVQALTVALLKGLLSSILEGNINYINAPHLAHQRGIAVSKTQGIKAPNYANLISCRVGWEGGARVISATLFGRDEPRIVMVDGILIDAQPVGTLMFMNNNDLPGVIGRTATFLGENGINIAEWRLGRTEPGGRALSFINLDSPVTPEMLDEIRTLEGVVSARQVML